MLTVTVANGSKVLCKDVRTLDLTFTAEGGDRQVTLLTQLYVFDCLQSDGILGMDFQKWYNPSIIWLDCRIIRTWLAANSAGC